MKKVGDREFENVIALDGEERYWHFVRRVADWEEVWSLRSGSGWVLYGDDDGRELVPVWPHARYADACARGEWQSAESAVTSVHYWLEKWLPGMELDARLVAVFPVPAERADPAVVVEASRLLADLKAEIAQYE